MQKTLENVDLEKLSNLKSIEQLFDYLLQFWGAKLLQS